MHDWRIKKHLNWWGPSWRCQCKRCGKRFTICTVKNEKPTSEKLDKLAGDCCE